MEFKEFVNNWKAEFIKRIKTASGSRKMVFTFQDAIERSEGNRTEKDKVFIDYFKYINSNPLRQNDYFKYLNSYAQGKRLNDKYFRHDLELLHELYKKRDDNPDYAPFSVQMWEKYVLFMLFKFKGIYKPDMDEVFGVKTDKNREYNPVTNLSRPLRGMLPKTLNLMEYDISRAYPTFIDIEIGIERKEDVYSLIDKRKFNRLINTHNGTKGATIEAVRAELSHIYNGTVEKVITEERFNNRGRMFEDLTKYEAESIKNFVEVNGIETYVRLHDAVIILASTPVHQMEFGKVVFKSKPVAPPEVVNNVKSFYYFNEAGEVVTSPVSYKGFFEQENLIRITEQDNDRITIFKDTNNTVKAFNYKTDTPPFLSSNINEFDTTEVENRIAKDNYSTIQGGFLLLNPKPLVYYSDTKETFGLPFKNGFALWDKNDPTTVKTLQYKEVNGFFAPHASQEREFEFKKYSEPGEFERFLTMVCTGKDPLKENLTESESYRQLLFFKMFGYLSHTYKNPSLNPAIILSDEGANDHARNGGRGKTIITKAIAQVQNTLTKGGNEFKGDYLHRFADLQKAHRVYVIDDAPAGFKYDDLYTNIVGDIACERKGKPAQTIKFEHAPKFVITTNWAVRYDAEATSTNRRFLEFKLTDYFNINNRPDQVFGHNLFEGWDAEEWNKFYNFVFACVGCYIELGLEAPKYDKTEDNFRAYFYNDVVLQEFERVFNMVSKWDEGFSVGDFLTQYKSKDNELRFENYFHQNNLKKLIETYITYRNLGIEYKKDVRKWIQV